MTKYRTKPDPGAPTALWRPLARRLDKLSFLLALVLTIHFSVISWVVNRPPIGFWLFALARAARLSRYFLPTLAGHESDTELGSVPAKGMFPWGDAFDTVSIAKVTLPPAPAEYQPKAPEAVKPRECFGFMLTPKSALGRGLERARKGEQIVLYYHGGAYVMGHALYGPFPAKIARDTNVRVYAATYRKAVSAKTAWPAQLQDGMAAWHYLVHDLGFHPDKIILLGDSAGGHLVHAVTRNLYEVRQPLPPAIVQISPWCDLTCSVPGGQYMWLDYISIDWGKRAAKSVLRWCTPDTARSVLVSPVFAPQGSFAYLARAGTLVYISYGTLEQIVDSVELYMNKLLRDLVDVRIFEDVDGLHIGPCLPSQVVGDRAYEEFVTGLNAVLYECRKRRVVR